MKHTTLLLTALLLTCNLSFGQTTKDDKEMYPDKYTFEKAKEFETKGEYEKAIWFYINLFPDNKEQVIETVKTLATKLDTVDMPMLIKKSFALYGTFDPAITTFNNGAPNMDMGKLKKKGAWGDELCMKITDPNKPLSSATEYNLRSIEKVKAKDFQGAIEDLNKAIELEPKGQFYFNRAYTKSLMEDFKGAIEDFNKTIELKYRLAEAYFERGYCKDMTSDFEGAISDYTNAIATNKEYPDAYNNRAFVYYKQKKYKEALKDFDKAIKLKDDNVGAYVNRGFVKKDMDDLKGACSDWQKAVELGYSDAQNFLNEYCK
ncbi:MAG: tetratricopeptide repeat protein [Bacteroidia bacterium]|nr:tetratricopeptide repeat protein [Bacteroidia bacterium]